MGGVIGDVRTGAHALNGASLFAAAVAIYFMLVPLIPRPIAASTALIAIWVSAKALTWGLEMHLLLALCAVYVVFADRHIPVGLVLGAAVLTRPDAFALVRLHLLRMRHRFREPRALRSAALFSAVVVPASLYFFFRFGQILPSTLEEKM